MIAYLEKNKIKFIQKLENARTPQLARAVIEEEIDRAVLSVSDTLTDDRQREAVSNMASAVRMAVPFLEAQKEQRISSAASHDKIYEKDHKKTDRWLPYVSLIVGIWLEVLSVILLVRNTTGLSVTEILLTLLLLTCSMIAVYVSGRSGMSKKRSDSFGHMDSDMMENVIDAQRVYVILYGIFQMIEKNLSVLRQADSELQIRDAGTDSVMLTDMEISLYADMLEALYSRDSDYVFDKLEEFRYYLYSKGIDIVEYSDVTARYFDSIPSKKKGTLRPALIRKQKVLKRGLAGSGHN